VSTIKSDLHSESKRRSGTTLFEIDGASTIAFHANLTKEAEPERSPFSERENGELGSSLDFHPTKLTPMVRISTQTHQFDLYITVSDSRFRSSAHEESDDSR
jgi:hypothetical protein